MLVLEGLIDLRRTIQLQLLQHYWSGHSGFDIEWFAWIWTEVIPEITLSFLRLHPITALIWKWHCTYFENKRILFLWRCRPWDSYRWYDTLSGIWFKTSMVGGKRWGGALAKHGWTGPDSAKLAQRRWGALLLVFLLLNVSKIFLWYKIKKKFLITFLNIFWVK